MACLPQDDLCLAFRTTGCHYRGPNLGFSTSLISCRVSETLLSSLCPCVVLLCPSLVPRHCSSKSTQLTLRCRSTVAMLEWRNPLLFPGALSSTVRTCLGLSHSSDTETLEYLFPERVSLLPTKMLQQPLCHCLLPSTSQSQSKGARIKQKPLLSCPQKLERGLESLILHLTFVKKPLTNLP